MLLWGICLALALLCQCSAQETDQQRCVPDDVCELPDIRGEAEDIFDGLSSGGEFPEEELKRARAGNHSLDAQIRNLESEYEDSLMARTAYTPWNWQWQPVCPHYHFHMWKMAFWYKPYGLCYALSPQLLVRCSTRNCRGVTPSIFYRCLPEYHKIYFTAWCPCMPFYFITYRYLPTCCTCRRFACRNDWISPAHPG